MNHNARLEPAIRSDLAAAAVAVHALLDRAFPHRDRITLLDGATTRAIDLGDFDPDRTTLAELRAAITSAPPPGPGGHLIVIDRPDATAPVPASRMEIDTGTGSVRVTSTGDVDERDLNRVVSRMWPLLTAADPHLPLQQVVAEPMPPPAPARPRPPLFLTRFLDLVRRHPDRVAVEIADRTLTYRELDEAADVAAGFLEARGMGPGRVVLVIPRRDEDLVALIVAAFKVGAALAVTNPTAPSAFVAECATAAGADLVIDLAGTGFPDAVRELPTAGPRDRAYTTERLAADDCAVVTFTSGTSGKPKAVRGRYGSLTYFFDWMDRHLGPLADTRFGMCSALGHDPLQRDVMTPLYLGTTVVVPPECELTAPGGLARWLAETGTQVVGINPSAIALLTATGRSLPDLRVVFLLGAALTRPQVEAMAAIAPSARLIALYGSTETQRAVAYFEVVPETLADLPDVIPAGRGMDDVQVLVLTPAGRTCLPWQSGQIAVRSSQIALGYAGDPDLTAAKFRPDLPLGAPPQDRAPTYLTGDLGFTTPGHGVRYLGRADAQVKINGHRIELDHVTAKARSQPGVRDAATVVAEVADAPALAVFLVPDSPAIRFDATAFRALLAEQLPPHMLPTRVITLAELPRTRNQKVDTAALIDRLAPRSERPADGRAPDLVRDYLHRLTGDPDPDPSIPLSDLGVDSLRLTALLGRLSASGISARAASTAMTTSQLVAAMSADATAPEERDRREEVDVRGLLGPVTASTETEIDFGGRRLHHLCSNSYLGLSGDPRLRASAARFLATTPSLGPHGSPELNSHTDTHQRLARALRALFACEAVTLYSSAFLANLAALPAIAGPGDTLFLDERCHRSLRDGAVLSGAALEVYRHNDPDHLHTLLGTAPTGGRRVIVTEGVFSVDGDIADLPGLAARARDHDALLYVDEASSVGQIGDGRGLEAHHAMPATIDVRVGSLGKALVGGGGFVAATAGFADRLRRRGTYSTALSPPAAHLAADALDLLRDSGPALTARLHHNRTVWAGALTDAGLDVGASTTAIVPLLLPIEPARAFHAALDAGVLALPLDSEDPARRGLRTTVTAAHDPAHLADLAARLGRALRPLTPP
ncbi:aminotransferase class I/II-fold pyridoxal phosphate-dependent enzyme [Spirillospora sp. CA-253888]